MSFIGLRWSEEKLKALVKLFQKLVRIVRGETPYYENKVTDIFLSVTFIILLMLL